VIIVPVPRKIFKKDRYTILRAKHLRPEQRQQVVTEALKLRDKKLDYAGLMKYPGPIVRITKTPPEIRKKSFVV
jgi:hypothetical protein